MDSGKPLDQQEHVDHLGRISSLEAQVAGLARENAALRQLVDGAPVSYQSLNDQGCITAVNQTWLDTLGYEANEVIGRPFSSFLPQASQAQYQEAFARFKAQGAIKGVEMVLVHKDGRPLLVTFEGKILYDEHGKFLCTHCIFINIIVRC